jgi:gas vesicle protein
MNRTQRALAALVLGLALVGATTAVAAADPATGTQQQQTDQRKALYQSELERNLQLGNQAQASTEHGLAAQRKALYQSELERNLATAGADAGQPAATTDPASSRPGLDGLTTLLIGLVAGLLVGAAAVLAWTATTHRRRPRAAASI